MPSGRYNHISTGMEVRESAVLAKLLYRAYMVLCVLDKTVYTKAEASEVKLS